jgi:hypothetical protein
MQLTPYRRREARYALILPFLLFSCTGQVSRCRIDSNGLAMNNAPLPEIVEKLSNHYGVAICNPRHIVGVSLTGNMTLFDSVSWLTTTLTEAEHGFAYLHYQENVIYIDSAPFPEHFVPDSIQWPCHK